MKFEALIAEMGDFSDLAEHDVALQFSLLEPVIIALAEMGDQGGQWRSEILRRFLTQHYYYGVYAAQVMSAAVAKTFRYPPPVMFSRSAPTPHPGKVRVDTYWVPEFGKNVAPIKVWVPSRLRRDLEALAAHTGITLPQYVREIVISRLLGHGTLPRARRCLKPRRFLMRKTGAKTGKSHSESPPGYAEVG